MNIYIMLKRGIDNNNGTVRFPDDNLRFQIDDMMTRDKRQYPEIIKSFQKYLKNRDECNGVINHVKG